MKGEEPARNTRASNREEFREGGRTNLAEKSFVRDTRKMWNWAPTEIKEAPTNGMAKQLIRSYSKILLI